ncbi:hypothetical protein BT96DRAFT_917222 [Gymnopus androsaceus JB14]|uniref:Uncharacterized protein n=1 Tax=Gymnopus androsaceus JB14 TaxID=1447944 RepID=A0A6A4I1I5_9AGAR|nr:hypothetical protein BT96DRAFT_917222 [Gymnopus androsaceus JB14]
MSYYIVETRTKIPILSFLVSYLSLIPHFPEPHQGGHEDGHYRREEDGAGKHGSQPGQDNGGHGGSNGGGQPGQALPGQGNGQGGHGGQPGQGNGGHGGQPGQGNGVSLVNVKVVTVVNPGQGNGGHGDQPGQGNGESPEKEAKATPTLILSFTLV